VTGLGRAIRAVRVLALWCTAALLTGCSSTPVVTPAPLETPSPSSLQTVIPTPTPSVAVAACLRAEYRLVPTDDAVTPDILETTRSIIEGRVVDSGLVGADVEVDGTDRIVVTFPETWDAEDLGDLITAPGRLDFVPIPADAQVEAGEPVPGGLEPLFGGDQLADLRLTTDTLGGPAIEFTLTPRAATIFGEWTEANIGRQFAIVLDGTIVSAPVVEGAITGGTGVITVADALGADVGRMMTILTYGSLPLPTDEVEVEPAACT
jgi:preprotein translocase subunit SecD